MNAEMATRVFRLPLKLTAILALALGTAFLSLGVPPSPAYAATFTVNSAADPGDGICDATECTLREAIDAANASAGADAITFSIGAGAQTIAPTSPLSPCSRSERPRITTSTSRIKEPWA